MAAPQKSGLLFYPRDVEVLRDRKFTKVKMKYGYLSLVVYDALLEMVYGDKGYYLDFSEENREAVVWDILDVTRGRYPVEPSTVYEVIGMLVECRLFSHDHYMQGIITSKRIQSTYYRCTVERKNVEVNPNIWMLTTEEMKSLSARSSILSFFINRTNIERISDDNQPINEDNQAINGVNQPINKQSKIKESKVKESKVKAVVATAAIEHYQRNIEPLPSPFSVEKLIDWVKTINEEVVICAIDEAVMSNVRNMKYIESILKRCLKQNIKTKAEFIAEREQHKIQKSTANGDLIVKQTAFNSYEQRDYEEEELERIVKRKNGGGII